MYILFKTNKCNKSTYFYFLQVSDEILHQKPNVESCYIAAQTMRSKIQTRFHEVPAEVKTVIRLSSRNMILKTSE